MGRVDTQLGQIEHHFWLTRSVARTIGLNLSEAMANGALSQDAYCDLVTRCRGGGCREACEHWLADQSGGAALAPPHCPIASDLNALLEKVPARPRS